MRLAVFTNQFPSKVSTFFARDMRALLQAGIDLEIFSIYPLNKDLWRYVPGILDESVLPREKVHHLNLPLSFRWIFAPSLKKRIRYFQDQAAISASAVKYGVLPLAKSLYVFPKTWAWAHQYPSDFDHILSYWGNYAGTCAYLFHRLTNPRVPFSILLHAGTDLYRNQVFLPQKLLYADNIFVVCEFNRQYLQNHYPDIFQSLSKKIYIHHPGLDFDEFPYRPYGRPSKKIIAVGRLEKKKGMEYLIRAAHELAIRGWDIAIELVGDGEQYSKLRELVDELKIAAKVKFSGWLEFEQVREAISRATILVHPSPMIGDAVPAVINEAMALGTPVIASNIAGIPELLDYGRCGVLVPPKDVKRLADAIESLMNDEAQRYRYAQAARSFAEERFDLWRNGARLSKILSDTIRVR